MKRYIRIWWIFTTRSTQVMLASRLGAVIFTIGKLLRFGLYLFFLFILVNEANVLAGYTLWEVVFFFATFNFIDTSAQFFLREVYRFRQHVVSGYFDNYLIKPMSPLFKALLGGSDVLDLSLLFVSVLFIFISGQHISFTPPGVALYLLLVLNACVITVAFHIVVVSLGILTTEVDNTLWMYRDLVQMGRIPIDVYQQPVRNIITFVIPVGIMMSFPVQALLGLLSVQGVITAFAFGGTFFLCSMGFWRYAIKQYSSASS